MKPFSLAFLVFLNIGILFSQTSNPKINILGIVSDSSNSKPMAYVAIALLDAKTQAPIKSTLSKEDGSFEISGTVSTQVELALAFTGYSN
ncbi:MAG: carboxypeptidase regulatory-like domain-containing protein [Bacteroidetes bacterium]|nr:carboxypeptidase regulatory-like domain-containing protein [Bacteroidota bacterium]